MIVYFFINVCIVEVLFKKLKFVLWFFFFLLIDEVNFIMSDGFCVYFRMCVVFGLVDLSLVFFFRVVILWFCYFLVFFEVLFVYLMEIKVKGCSSLEISSGSDSMQEEEDLLVKFFVNNLFVFFYEFWFVFL